MKILSSSILYFLWSFLAIADELKLSYLEITETQAQHYRMLLKVPSTQTERLMITMPLPKECHITVPKRTQRIQTSTVERWNIYCQTGLANKTLRMHGLQKRKMDVLLRLDLLSHSHSVLLTPSASSYTVPKEEDISQIFQTYTWLGVTHILLGFDHLLFVFALLLIVKSVRRLLWTITAFTLAHSLTMAMATLGIMHIPQAPVEAIIALSILFLAREILHEKQGKIGLTSHYPWLIAFIFGLLHGFGFAGALAEIGLPPTSDGSCPTLL
ncbi:MAG: HupE/UreJ family protein [Sulfurovum sp.]|nr:HupE/UreJ family protein [Sulfurovum sp.]